ncbi:MarR family winged helix-turn-helix transcriptional regulator [Phytohabitans houttuyneae]|uniref:MarR family transcriptional regulator n=1 Tax=Phytohabitans houttuyneae TaxID=1076126 RepID=A0A6V8KQ55_9ACTN|nr:MarR family winged helix-turn-helix transcriptional regulator [Phytohabitans houttuyneae]GFJ84369.1 MarR family transcriptional regulator [Phytohabitans houttuyneae]
MHIAQDISAGAALFRLVRFWGRRWAAQPAGPPHVAHVQVLEALDAAATPTIAAVASQLGLDRSVGSRMVSETVAAGYLTRRPDPGDARRTLLAPTAAGRELLRQARQWQQRVFLELTDGWSAADRERFGGYLRRLVRENR